MAKSRYFILAIGFLAVIACSEGQGYDISGNWIGYKAARIINKDTMQDNFHLLLTFRGDSIFVRNFKYIREGDKDSLSVYSYSIHGDSLITTDKEGTYFFRIVEQNSGELVLSTGRTKLFYRKIDNIKAAGPPTDLSKHVYTINRYGKLIDTARFWDNQAVEMYNRALKRPHKGYFYSIKKFAGHELLVIDSPQLPVFMISQAGEGTFELKKEPLDTAGFLMQEIRR